MKDSPATDPLPPEPPSAQERIWSMPAFGPPTVVAQLAAQDADPVVYATAKGIALFEPTVAFASDGSLFVSAPYCPASAGSCSSHPSAMWHGPPAGPFVHVTPPAEDGIGGNGDSFVLTVGDEVFMLDQGGGAHQVYRSSDNGTTWMRSQSVQGSPDRPWMAGRPEALAITYYEGGAQYVVRSHDRGASWNEPTEVAATTYPGGQLRMLDATTWAFPLLQESDQLPGLAGAEKCGPRSVTVQVAVTRDGGDTWNLIDTGARFDDSVEQVPGACAPSATMPAFDVDGAGGWHVAWSEPDPEGQLIRVVSSPDDGSSWGEPVSPRGTAGAAVFPWLVSRGAGDLTLMYFASDADLDANSNPGPWRLEFAWSGDGGRAWTLHDLGRVHDGPVCTGGGGCRTTDRSLGDFVQFVAGPDGRLAATWSADLALPARGTQILVAVSSAVQPASNGL